MTPLEIVVKTIHGYIPLHIYSPEFSWRGLVFPPIVSIKVGQGNHVAEIGDYEQYNFMLEATKTAAGFTPGSESTDIRRFWVMGKKDLRVDLYIFSLQNGIIKTFQRDTAVWGSELDGASTTGWKVGIEPNTPRLPEEA